MHSVSNELNQKKFNINHVSIKCFGDWEVIKSVNTSTRVVNWFQFELFHKFNSNGNASNVQKTNLCERAGGFSGEQDNVVITSGWGTRSISTTNHNLHIYVKLCIKLSSVGFQSETFQITCIFLSGRFLIQDF